GDLRGVLRGLPFGREEWSRACRATARSVRVIDFPLVAVLPKSDNHQTFGLHLSASVDDELTPGAVARRPPSPAEPARGAAGRSPSTAEIADLRLRHAPNLGQLPGGHDVQAEVRRGSADVFRGDHRRG